MNLYQWDVAIVGHCVEIDVGICEWVRRGLGPEVEKNTITLILKSQKNILTGLFWV